MTSWLLEDADAIAAAHKYTFYKPSAQTIAQVRPGETVKLMFGFASDAPDAPRAERMWVLVDAVNADGSFAGRLDNQPRWIKDLQHGDPVRFDASHIINTEHDEDDNIVERYSKLCFVTNRILHDGKRVAYLYREAPDNDSDSGWRFLADDETDEYMDDADNLALVSLGALLSIDDSFIGLLEAPEGSAFTLDPLTQEFVAADA